jgi:hypothetical protein
LKQQQQKIIRKLAQIQPGSNAALNGIVDPWANERSVPKFDADSLNQILHNIPDSEGYNVIESSIQDGKAFMKVQIPDTVSVGMPDPIWNKFMEIVKNYMGPSIQFAGGQPIKMMG